MSEITLIIQPGFQMPGRPRCFSGSPFAIKVQRILQYKRLSFRVRDIGWMEREELLPEVSASRKLPVLEYDGERIEDSTVIAYALEALHPEPRLLPGDEILAARCHFLEEWADEALYWYGIYEQVRMTGGDFVYAAYYAGLPDEFRVAAIERVVKRVEENLDRHWFRGTVLLRGQRSAWPTLQSSLKYIGVVPGPIRGSNLSCARDPHLQPGSRESTE